MLKLSSTTVIVTGVFLVAFGLFFSSSAFADIMPPKQQMKFTFEVGEVLCNEGMVKVIKTSSNLPACVKPSTAEKLIQKGWANPIDQKIIDDVKARTLKPIGTVTSLSVVKTTVDSGRLDSSPPTSGYYFAFDVCATYKQIQIPEILIESDSEATAIVLAESIPANTCQTTATKIKASNSDSIKATLINKGGISTKISDLKKTIADLKEQINTEKAKFYVLVKLPEKPDNFKEQVSEMTNKISDMRNSLNTAKGELERYYFSLYVTPSKVSKENFAISFGKVPIQGALVNKLAVTKQLESIEPPFGYNVVFEACAGNDIIRIPEVVVTSDLETKSVKLANKISPNSCQLGNSKISANDESTIMTEFADSADISTKIEQLENKISTLEKAIQADKKALNELTHMKQRPSDFNEQLVKISDRIIDLRNQIINAKTELHTIQFQFYS